jgi:peptidoglycan/LPS O-acetylase OafA/YrhL
MKNLVPAPHRLEWLDELRGLAALCVLVLHLGFNKFAIARYVDPGVFGVAVFFCISGYIIPQSLKAGRAHGVRRFIKARIFRLYPAYWVSLLIGVLVFHASCTSIFINATMLQSFIGVKDIVGVYWTLQVEIMFYAAIVVVYMSGRLGNIRVMLGLAAGLAAIAFLLGLGRFYLNHKFSIAPPIGLSIMCLSAAFAHRDEAMRGHAAASAPAIWPAAVVVCALLYGCFGFGYSRDWGYGENPFRFMCSDTLAVLVFLLYRRLNFGNGAFLFLGRISYPLYLTHTSIIELFKTYWHLPPFSPLTLGPELIVILGLAWAMHVWVEKPMIGFGRRLMKPAAAAAAL